jgi:hypothetical protein
LGLILEVAEVLASHGYPRLEAAQDVTALQQALFRFIYRPAQDDLICSRCLRRQSRHGPNGRDAECPDGFVPREDAGRT